VRLAAADFLARAGDKTDDLDRRALVRCASEDRDGAVATRCAASVNKDSVLVDPPGGTDDVAVYVVPDGRSAPVARASFALVRADGLLRLGVADRRGELFEADAPRGVIRLAVPASLAR
jgi:hypothetical protein